MAYIDQTGTEGRKTATIGVVAIHALIGTVLVTGLTTSFISTEEPGPLVSTEFTIPPPPPPPPVDPQKADPAKPTNQQIYLPPKPFDLAPTPPDVDTTSITLPPLPDVITQVTPGPVITPVPPTPPAQPKFDAISAKPRNNPGGWVSTSDYRSIWIRKELTGTASFKLAISASGRVENCEITSSTGHRELDQATCRLVQRRAKFTPARDTAGRKVPSSFTTSIKWQLPD